MPWIESAALSMSSRQGRGEGSSKDSLSSSTERRDLDLMIPERSQQECKLKLLRGCGTGCDVETILKQDVWKLLQDIH